MSYYSVIRVPLSVENCHALAGFYTEGPSIASLYGLVSRIEEEANLKILGFGVVLERYDGRITEFIKHSMDAVGKENQKTMPPLSAYRHADMRLALYLKLDAIDKIEQDDIFTELGKAVNRSRVQGGMVFEQGGDENAKLQHSYISVENQVHDLLTFIDAHEFSLSQVYSSAHLTEPLSGEDLIEAYAKRLLANDTVLVCNGYVVVGTAADMNGQQHDLAENSYTLAKIREVYVLKKEKNQEALNESLTNFFWKFDTELHSANPMYLVVS